MFISLLGHSQNKELDSLYNQLANASTATDSISLYAKIAYITTHIDPNESIVLSKNLLTLSEKHSNFEGIAKAYDILGISNVHLSNYDIAFTYLNKGLKIAEKYKLDATKASIYNHIGKVHRYKNQYYDAVKITEKAIAINQALNNNEHLAECLKNIAIIYIVIGEYDMALEQLHEALALLTKQKEGFGAITVKKNMGLVEAYKENYTEALCILKEVYAFEDSIGYTFRKLHTAMNIGGVYLYSENYPNALAKFEYTLSLLEKVNNEIIKRDCYISIAIISFETGNIEKAEDFALKAYKLTKRHTISGVSIRTINFLSHLYEEKKDYKNALEFSRLTEIYKDSLNIGEAQNSILKERLQLDLKKLALQKEKDLADVSNKTNKYIMRIGFTFFTIILILIYFNREKLSRINKKLIFSNETKSNFLTKMTHEVKTPLNAIIGYSDLLLSFQNLTEVQKRHINTIKSSGDSLLVMAEDIFDFNRYGKNKVNLNPKPTDLKAVLTEIFEMFQLTASKKNIIFKLNVSEEIPKTLLIDKLKLRRVLYSLLENAFKYTSSGTITFNAKLINKLKKNSEIKISISDTGRGIQQESLQKIFDEFYQEESDYTREVGGIGLGLSLSSKIVDILGGTLEVESEPNKGSTFYFTLNFPHGTEEKALKDKLVDEFEDRAFKLLIVEDNKINLLLTKKLLASLYKNIIIYEAYDGQMGVELYAKERPDIILMDIQMPVLNGLKATEIIRNRYSTTIPILALSAGSARENQEKSISAGITEYMEKPINLKILRETLYKYIIKL